MACTLEKVLGDARTLLERLKEHDTAAEGLIEQSGALSQRVQGMREVGNALPDKYPEESSEIQDLSKYKPHVLLSQENTQIKELQQENKELWVSLEEHQYALELIMGRYRKQMLQLMMGKKELDTKPVLNLHEDHAKEVQSQLERICEMGQVMRRAVQVDDQHYCSVRERLAQLEIENKELRDLLSISKISVKGHSEDPSQRATVVKGHSEDPSQRATVVKGHSEDPSQGATVVKGHSEDPSQRATVVKGHSEDPSQRATVVKGHSEDPSTLGTVVKGHSEDPSQRATVVKGHSEDPSQRATVVKGHSEDPSTLGTVVKDHSEDPSQRATVVKGHSEDPSQRATVVKGHSEDPSQRATVVKGHSEDPSTLGTVDKPQANQTNDQM
ncbi:suppressor of IKBKE 1 isoform X2 [Hypomesus transpacificus]|uniref:suppressor of IKBKE 1 isoform X2 n=1 Tax=Hypomesus transpacificus TaxID=137520 RepID=UPI001F076B77|nr:suppressor of IKBKE 1 isoform X2 [Hypomesus transpacificus]